MILSQDYSRQLRGDFFQILLNSFGKSLQTATTEELQKALLQTKLMHDPFNRDNADEFKTFFRTTFRKEYSKAGCGKLVNSK